MIKKRWLFIILTATLFSGCFMHRVDRKLRAENKTEQEVSVLVNFDFPDISITNADILARVRPFGAGYVGLQNRKWEEELKEVGKITVFFVNREDVVKNEGLHKERYAVLKEMILTKAELDSLGWLIQYP